AGCKYEVIFGTLFNDDKCATIFEALVGTLRAAKKKKIIKYDGELSLQGVHDKIVISLC
ncbi:costars family protein ABRACL, partial [Biomphalaria glabrata]